MYNSRFMHMEAKTKFYLFMQKVDKVFSIPFYLNDYFYFWYFEGKCYILLTAETVKAV